MMFIPRKKQNRNKLIFRIHFLWWMIFIILIAKAVYGETPVATLRIDKKVVGVGEKLGMNLSVEWAESDNPKLHIVKIFPPLNDQLEIINSSEQTVSRLTEKGIFIKRVVNYIFQAKEKGQVDDLSAVIEVISGDDPDTKRTISSETVSVKIVSPIERMAKKISFVIFSMLVIIVTAGGTIFLIKRMTAKTKKQTDKKSLDLEQPLLSKLKEGNSYYISGDIQKYYSYIEEILTRYQTDKYSRYNTEVPFQLQAILRQWHEIAEKVCFAGYTPPQHEHERLVRQTVIYFEALLSTNDPGEKIEIIN